MPYDIRHGHCLDLIPEIPDEYLDCVVTSPPWWGEDYDVPLQSDWGRLGHEALPGDYIQKLVRVCNALKPKMKRSGILWWILADVPDSTGELFGIPYGFANEVRSLYWTYTVQWIWTSSDRDSRMPTHGPLPAHCPVIGLTVDPEYHYWRGEEPDWIACPGPHREKSVSWATLPVPLVRWCLEHSCPDGGKVLDPFMGSGTVLGTAHAYDYYGIGMELDEKAVKGAQRKIRRMRTQAENGRSGVQQKRAGLIPPKVTQHTEAG